MVVRRIAGAYRAAYSGLSRDAWLLALVAFVNRSGTMVLPFLSLYLTRSLGFTLVEAGQVLAAYGLGSVVGAPLGGWLTDRIGPRRVMLASLLAAGAGFLIVSQLRAQGPLAASVALTAIAADALRPAVMSAAALASVPAMRARSMALIRLAVNLGTTVGPIAGGLLAARWPLGLFLADAATGWAAAAILAIAWRRRAEPVAGRAGEARPARAPSRGGPLRDLPFLAFLALTVALTTVFFQIFGAMPVHLRDNCHLAEPAIGALLALNCALIVVFEMLVVKALERFSPVRVVAVGSLLVCSGLALLAAGIGTGWAIASVLVWTAGEMLALPAANAAVGLRAGEAGVGRYMGAYTLAFSIGFLLAPAIGSAVYERLGPDVLWLSIGGLGPLLFAGYFGLSRAFRATPRP